MIFHTPKRGVIKTCLCALVLIFALFVAKALTSPDYDADSIYLFASVSSPVDGVAALYYDVGKGFNDNHLIFVPIRGGNRAFDYFFKMPNQTIFNLKCTLLLETQQAISIYKMTFLDGFRKPIANVNLNQIEPLKQVWILQLSNTKVDLELQAEANDPQFQIRLESPLSAGKWSSSFSYYGTLFLEFIGALFISCLLIFIWFYQTDKVIAVFLIIAFVFFGARFLVLYDDAKSLFLEVTTSSSVSSMAQLFYDLGQGLNEDQSQITHTKKGDQLRKYRFKMPNKKIHTLRYDPLFTEGQVSIKEIRVTDYTGNLLRKIPLGQIKLIDPHRVLYFGDDRLDIAFPKSNKDPKFMIPLEEDLDFVDKLPFPMARWFASVMTELVLITLIAFCFIFARKKRWGNLF